MNPTSSNANPPLRKTFQPQIAGYAGLIAALAGIAHAIIHKREPGLDELTLWISALCAGWGNIMSRQWNVSSEEVGKESTPRRTLPPRHYMVMGAIGLLALTLVGCVRRDKGDIVGATTTCVGIDVSQTADSGSPHFRIGYIRTQYHLVPTVKGSNSITAPDVAASIHTDVSLSRTDISEDFATGQAAQDAAYQEGPTTARQAVAAKAETKRATASPAVSTNTPTSTRRPRKKKKKDDAPEDAEAAAGEPVEQPATAITSLKRGTWTIVIQGEGPLGNGKEGIDHDISHLFADVVRDLVDAGHRISVSNLTVGPRTVPDVLTFTPEELAAKAKELYTLAHEELDRPFPPWDELFNAPEQPGNEGIHEEVTCWLNIAARVLAAR